MQGKGSQTVANIVVGVVEVYPRKGEGYAWRHYFAARTMQKLKSGRDPELLRGSSDGQQHLARLAFTFGEPSEVGSTINDKYFGLTQKVEHSMVRLHGHDLGTPRSRLFTASTAST